MSRGEMEERGWDTLDVLFISGDAYVDHPSFGVALLGRYLEANGLRVGIVSQPRWQDAGQARADIAAMGRPRLFVGISAGAVDSMVAHYTAFRKKRRDDAYTPGGQAGARPNRATVVYTGLARSVFPGIPVILGGIEASLRRISHYDFWADALRRPLLFDSKADLLVYGMGEYGTLAIARKAEALTGTRDEPVSRAALAAACRAVPGLAYLAGKDALPPDPMVMLPPHEDILKEPTLLMQATLALEKQVHGGTAHAAQRCGERLLVLTPPAPALSEAELDALYSLPFTRLPHPAYTQSIPAWEMIRTSITTHRGCGGGCSFCSLALHQGRRIASRSRDSILAEASRIAQGLEGNTGASCPASTGRTKKHARSTPGTPPRWAGSISDVGGPSANMWRATCSLPKTSACVRASCMHPAICPFFTVDQREGARLLRAVAAQPGVRHVRVASGVRFDLALRDSEALMAYTSEFTGGQLKVAPEHTSDAVLTLMRKPGIAVFERFLVEFSRHSENAGKEQYTVPYLMSAFPGCSMEHMRELAVWLGKRRWKPQQVQCFIPTPGTVATAMFYAGVTPGGSPLYVARSDRDRMRQHFALTGERE